MATSKAEKQLEEKVLPFLRKETEEARDAAEELRRRKAIDHQGSCTTAMKELDRQTKN